MNSEINKDISFLPQAVKGRETIILLATPGMHEGPQSPLAKLVRQFEPYWHLCKPQPIIFASEDSYRTLLRCGLLRSYPSFYSLPPRLSGTLVYASDLVITSAPKDPDDPHVRDPKPVRVFYLIDPSDPTSLYPETVALKRDTVVAGKTFLATEAGIEEWLTLDLYAHLDLPKLTNLSDYDRFWLDQEESEALLDALEQPDVSSRNIALIAHDRKKKDLLQFAIAHFDLLHNYFRERYATGTTGKLLNGEDPLRSLADPQTMSLLEIEALRMESHSAFTSYFDHKLVNRIKEDLEEINKLKEELKNRLSGERWVQPQPSGPRGGDTQIARRILDRQCEVVLFFEDPHYAREHEADIQLLERTSRIPDLRVLCIHDKRSAETWASNWEKCIENKVQFPITLVQVFRRVFGVELVLAYQHLISEKPPKPLNLLTEQEVWENIVETAAFYVTSLTSTIAQARKGVEPVRVGVPWGLGVRELLKRIADLKKDFQALDQETGKKLERLHIKNRNQLERSGRWPPRLTISLGAEDFLRPGNVYSFPVIGVMGAWDARVEANSNAALLSKIFGGKSETFGYFAFCKQEGAPDIPEILEAGWKMLDILILMGEKPRERLGSKVHANIPEDLWKAVQGSVGECAGLYLHSDGSPWTDMGEFKRQGIGYSTIREIAARRGSILVIGAQERRVPVAEAMLRGRLVSTLITDPMFA